MTRLTALDDGTYYHDETLRGARFGRYFDRVIYLPDFDQEPLDQTEALYVTSRSNPNLLRRHETRLRRYLADGGTLVVMGECEAHTWLPLSWTYTETNFWWWLEPGASLGLSNPAPDHPLMERMALRDATWHYHGYFTPATGATSIVDCAEGGSILLEDRTNFGAGRLLATTLDPCYHHGSFFMPAATRFLDRFLPWLRDTIA